MCLNFILFIHSLVLFIHFKWKINWVTHSSNYSGSNLDLFFKDLLTSIDYSGYFVCPFVFMFGIWAPTSSVELWIQSYIQMCLVFFLPHAFFFNIDKSLLSKTKVRICFPIRLATIYARFQLIVVCIYSRFRLLIIAWHLFEMCFYSNAWSTNNQLHVVQARPWSYQQKNWRHGIVKWQILCQPQHPLYLPCFHCWPQAHVTMNILQNFSHDLASAINISGLYSLDHICQFTWCLAYLNYVSIES